MNYKDDLAEFREKYTYSNIDVNGVTFRYLLSGSGKQTLVFLVGGMGVSEMWMHYIIALEKDFKILTFNYPFAYKTNQQLCDGICGLLEKLQIEKAILVGSSYGGYLGQIFARKYPEKVQGLCLFSTAGLNQSTLGKLRLRAKHAGKLLWLIKHVPYAWLKPIFYKSCMRHIVNAREEEYCYMRDMFQEIFKDYTGELDYHMTSLLVDITKQTPCVAEEFAYLESRVLLILPEKDDSFTPEMQKDLIAMMRNPMIVEGVDTGHLSTILKIDDYVKAIREFVQTRLL